MRTCLETKTTPRENEWQSPITRYLAKLENLSAEWTWKEGSSQKRQKPESMKENLEQRQDPKMLAAGSQEMAGSQRNCLQMLTWTENLRLSMY